MEVDNYADEGYASSPDETEELIETVRRLVAQIEEMKRLRDLEQQDDSIYQEDSTYEDEDEEDDDVEYEDENEEGEEEFEIEGFENGEGGEGRDLPDRWGKPWRWLVEEKEKTSQRFFR